MSYFLFVDESGQDGVPPYEVLAGVAIEDRELWNLIQRIHSLEIELFGERVSAGGVELKGKKILKNKVFRHAGQEPPLPPEQRRDLAAACLEKGSRRESPTRLELTALAQAKVELVSRVLELCAQHRAHVFASIIDKDAPRPSPGDYLRKDYAYLFERYFYFLEDRDAMGAVVFDELEKSRCHILIDQMEKYFLKTDKGRARSSLVIPEPLFVHSDLTTAVQLADLAAYIISWGLRLPRMGREARGNLKDLAQKVLELRYRTARPVAGPHECEVSVWSFAVIDDLRSREERNGTGA